MNNVIDTPWFIVGDLNELKNLSNKKGEARSLLEGWRYTQLSHLRFKENALLLRANRLHGKDNLMAPGFMNGCIKG